MAASGNDIYKEMGEWATARNQRRALHEKMTQDKWRRQRRSAQVAKELIASYAQRDALLSGFNSGKIDAGTYYSKMATLNGYIDNLENIRYTSALQPMQEDEESAWKESDEYKTLHDNAAAEDNKKQESSGMADTVKGTAAAIAGNLAMNASAAGGLDRTGGSTGLRNQAEQHEKQVAAEKKNEQQNRQIANRDYRGEADKNAAATAAFQNAQNMQNMGAAVGNAAAALNRQVATPDYDTHMVRQDQQRAEAVKNQREAYGAQQTAIQERADAENMDYRARQMAAYNNIGAALSAGYDVGSKRSGEEEKKEENAKATDAAMVTDTPQPVLQPTLQEPVVIETKPKEQKQVTAQGDRKLEPSGGRSDFMGSMANTGGDAVAQASDRPKAIPNSIVAQAKARPGDWIEGKEDHPLTQEEIDWAKQEMAKRDGDFGGAGASAGWTENKKEGEGEEEDEDKKVWRGHGGMSLADYSSSGVISDALLKSFI